MGRQLLSRRYPPLCSLTAFRLLNFQFHRLQHSALTSEHTTNFKSTFRKTFFFPIRRHVYKLKGERCHYHQPSHASPRLCTEASGHQASIAHDKPLTRAPGARPCHCQQAHRNGLIYLPPRQPPPSSEA